MELDSSNKLHDRRARGDGRSDSPPMIRWLQLENFKAYQSTGRVPLSPLTVLVGANGSGKTTLLHALDLLGGLTRGTLKEHLTANGWDYGDLPHLLSDSQRFGVEVGLGFDDGSTGHWRLELETRRRPGIASEQIVRDTPEGQVVLAGRTGRSMHRIARGNVTEKVTQTLTSSWLATIDAKRDLGRYPELARIAAWARGIRGYYFLDPRVLRRPSQGSDEPGTSGERLAGYLGRIAARDKAALGRITARVQVHYPRLTELQAKRGKYGWSNLIAHERWGRKTVPFNARQVSDGLLRLITVAALHEVKPLPSLMLFDEIENGLHPRLLEGVMAMLQELVDAAHGATQVVLTTHSPIALNYVPDPAQVIVVHRDARGVAQATPLPQADGFARLRRHLQLGELWYNVGEDRLFAAKPGA